MFPNKKFGAFKKVNRLNSPANNRQNLNSDQPSQPSQPSVLSGFEAEESENTAVYQAIKGVEKPTSSKPKQPLVIPFEESHRSYKKKLYKPELSGRDPSNSEIILMESTLDAKKIVPGLTKVERVVQIEIENAPATSSSNSNLKDESVAVKEEQSKDLNDKDLDNLAAQMLIAEANGVSSVAPGQTRVIKTEASELSIDIGLCPDANTLEDYENVPIEGFGEALLRGMGWQEGQSVGKKQRTEVDPVMFKPRVSLLGLGAKPKPEFLKENPKRKFK